MLRGRTGLGGRGKWLALAGLLQALALRTGGALNVADVGRSLGINQMTLKRYITLLEVL